MKNLCKPSFEKKDHAAIAATYEKQAAEGSVRLQEAEYPVTFKDAYLLISNRVDAPEEAATAYARRWRIEVFYRMAKQNLGLTSCYVQSEAGCRIHCSEQLIQVYFDTATERFARLIDKFWPKSLELRLWSWEYYPGTA